MSVLRRFGMVAVAGLAALGAVAPPAWGQVRSTGSGFFPGQGGRRIPTVGLQSANNITSTNPRWFIAPGLTLNQYAANVATLGRAASNIPPYMLGFNPYPQAINTGPNFSPINPFNPTLSTGFNPYVPGAGTGALVTDPYAGGGSTLSTVPGGGGYGGSGNGYMNPYYPTYYPNPTESVYKGAAEYMRGEADYYKGIQQAKLLREQARQAAADTRKRLLQEEIDFERMRPKAPDLRAREERADRDLAQRATGPEVWSGRALNSLLRSVAEKGGRGPSIPLEEDTLKGLNLTDKSSRGNLGVLKNAGALRDLRRWPSALQEEQYEEPRKRLARNLRMAAEALKDRDAPDRATLQDLKADYNALSKDLESSVGDLSPSQYIEARRFLGQVRDAIRGLSDPKAASWAPRGQTVGELVDYLRSNGLEFAPATEGDERAYNALYQALRAFERSLDSR
jgi:hypothetical protein